ncbi:hypothetical protein K458DRAFT_481444 [Lentithecium fluviatile CBS 122367]|uniref:Rhodopsin domain-containing protein n=1 Tax=Lentithecium fluviatile CBS 122367 TaxID=1168545 RepID=A0A6G1IG41_9PLEO|nr:hypothetical protein K458DRAFT_481444 [Lentithecium fluviatile CBS 122367]
MLLHAPDPNEPLPISNRKETIYGAIIPFLLVSWVAIGLRMWVRFRIMREPGWDDFFVVLAGCLNTAATTLVLVSINYGLGQHYLYIGASNMVKYQQVFYAENAIYITETAIIKISLLLQYLRIFKAGTMRWICISLLCIISLWGVTYATLAWLPCWPVRAFWNRLEMPDAKCWGFGFADLNSFISLFESHTALNMVFDFTVFMTPMVLFSKPNLRMKNAFAMAGIFVTGAVVVFTSIWRLTSIVTTKAATQPFIDFTWWAPLSILLSCLEIDLAITCASMPVFWPHFEKSVSAIFVTHEVHVTEHRRLDDTDHELELVHSNSCSLRRKASGKSESGNSRETLNRTEGGTEQAGYYQDAYVAAQVVPMEKPGLGGMGLETNVDSEKPPKWNL